MGSSTYCLHRCSLVMSRSSPPMGHAAIKNTAQLQLSLRGHLELRVHIFSSYHSRQFFAFSGLIVPENCGLTVNNVTRSWQKGKCLLFDDSYLHSAENRQTSGLDR